MAPPVAYTTTIWGRSEPRPTTRATQGPQQLRRFVEQWTDGTYAAPDEDIGWIGERHDIDAKLQYLNA